MIARSRRSPRTNAVSLRPALPADAALIYAALEQTMRGFALATWGNWSPAKAREESEHDAHDPRTRIVQCNGVDCGVLQVDQRANEWWVQMCYLLPTHQGMGIGRVLLREIQERAQRGGLPVRLRVLKVNPAKAFYLKLGFVVYQQCDDFFYLQWQA